MSTAWVAWALRSCPLLVLERRGVIDAGKRLIFGNGDAQERAQRLPGPLLGVKDQQPVGGADRRRCG